MDDIQLRPAAQADVPAVLAVTAAAYAEYAGRLQPDAGALHETAEAVERYLRAGGVIVAEAQGELVGAVRYEPHEDFVYLGRLAVIPAWRGRGIGRRLVEAVEDWAILLGLDEVRLGVRLELVENREIYSHLGYVEDGLAPFKSDPQRSYLRMKKRLRE
jgi:GNAT superfamily N-acetyltransferase